MKRLLTTVAILTLSCGLALAQGGGGGSSGGSAGSGGGAAGSSSSGNAAAQSSAPSPSAGTTGSNAAAQQQTGAGTSSTPGAQVNGPNNTGGPVPGLAAPSSPDLTVGRGPGVNPANPQDATRRGNPSDRTLPGARNPQDMKAFDNGVPQIIKPER